MKVENITNSTFLNYKPTEKKSEGTKNSFSLIKQVKVDNSPMINKLQNKNNNFNVNAFSPATSKRENSNNPSAKISVHSVKNIKSALITINQPSNQITKKIEDPKQIEINLTDDLGVEITHSNSAENTATYNIVNEEKLEQVESIQVDTIQNKAE